MYLPTYAPWLNPIEKLWRWLCQEVLHLHRLADRRDQLQRTVDGFLGQFAEPHTAACQALLRYVGLAHPGGSGEETPGHPRLARSPPVPVQAAGPGGVTVNFNC